MVFEIFDFHFLHSGHQTFFEDISEIGKFDFECLNEIKVKIIQEDKISQKVKQGPEVEILPTRQATVLNFS